MRFHDFTLESYKVLDQGKTIILDLKLKFKNNLNHTEESRIKFSDVTLYNFTHVSGSIITNIEDVDIEILLTKKSTILSEWNRMFGITNFKGNIQEYISFLVSSNFKAWEITSAIGFYGFVVCKNVENI